MIVPSVDIVGGQTVQLVGGRDQVLDAGDPQDWVDRFAIAGEVAIVDLDAALGRGDQRALIARLCRRAPCRVGGGIRSLETARFWLNSGATRIVVGTAATAAFLAELPRDRTIAALDAMNGEVVIDGWRTATGRRVLERIADLRDLVGGFLVTFVEREGRMGGIDLDAVREIVDAAGSVRVTIAGGITTPDDIANLDAIGADAQVGMALYTGRLTLGAAVGAPLHYDRPDGLIPTVVVDECGTALGLAWSSRATLERAVAERRGIYHSRRRGVWVKGEKSGATQQLLRVDLDCDRDALRFMVRQADPGFCHTGTWTCWNDAPGFAALERTLRQRRSAPEVGSYTQRLWADDALLSSKLGEEAGELAAAHDRDDVIGEAADLQYFAMVKLAGAGVAMADVAAELDRRSRTIVRRPGNAKLATIAVPSPVREPFAGMQRVTPTTLPVRIPSAIDEATLGSAREIVDAVRRGGREALLEYARRFDGWDENTPWRFGRDELAMARANLDPASRALLERIAERIRAFATAQRAALADVELGVPGGRAGHTVLPMARAGCYAPAGRFPLPSSLLMGVITARAAGVGEVWVASPRPGGLMLAAASIGGATGVIGCGGAHAIAALAYGIDDIAACDVVVGPGNRWVTAAKKCIAGDVAIDFLAGPSELVVLADATANPARVAADLLAQAEHDADALPILVTTDATLLDAVDRELRQQLRSLPEAAVAQASLRGGYAVICDGLDAALAVIDTIAPEHLQLCVNEPRVVAARVQNAGALFLGHASAEVFGDYGAGPNHVLPTGGAARFTGGLSVLHFLRVRTWLDISEPGHLGDDTAAIARLEGLEAHARAAEIRDPATGKGGK